MLAALGIYSVIAWLVAQRTREIGVRMALGASKRDVITMMSLHGLKPVVVGLAIGFVGALGATRLLQNQLFEVGPRDPIDARRDRGVLLVVAARPRPHSGVARHGDRSVDRVTGVARGRAAERPTARSHRSGGCCASQARIRASGESGAAIASRRCTNRFARSPGSRNVTPSCPLVITSPSTGA